MIALLAATAALSILSPPVKFDRGIPPGYTVQTVPLALVRQTCEAADTLKLLHFDREYGTGYVLMGCTLAYRGLIVLPVEDETFPYEHACYLMNARHEGAHGWGWPGTHAGGHSYTCSPKGR